MLIEVFRHYGKGGYEYSARVTTGTRHRDSGRFASDWKAFLWARRMARTLETSEVVPSLERPSSPSVMPKPVRRTKPTPCAPGSCELCDDRRDMQWQYTQEDHA